MACRITEDKMFKLRDSIFTTVKVSRFFEAIRAIGMEGKYQLPRGESVRQYVICGVFSQEEIESNDGVNSQIKAMEDYLIKLDSEDKDGKYGSKFICRGRIAVLLNCFGRHGETRLFDPDRTILRDLGVVSEDERNDVFEKHEYLQKMKKQFKKEFGKDKQYFIVLLSHLIPCTVEGHKCSLLLKEYVERQNEFLIVSYDTGWQGTKKRESLTNLTHANIHVVKPTVRRDVVNGEIGDIQRRIGDVKRLESLENDEQTGLEAPYDQANACVSKRQKIREKRETENSVHPYCDRKRKTLGEYHRQSSKSERNKLWDT